MQAELNSTGITALAQYELNENFSVHGGIRQNTIDMNIALPAIPALFGGPVAAYTATGASSSAMGYVIGAAYEIPDIALRAAITYSSETNHDVVTTENVGVGVTTTRITMPKSVNFDFQTGVAPDTLAMFGVRYVNWTSTVIDPAGHRGQRGTALQTYSEDSYTFSLGMARRFSESFAGSATLGWERPQGGDSGNLAPTDGNVSLSVGGAYTLDNMEISGGIRYVRIGDATTATAGAQFNDNSAIALGLKVGFNF